MSGRIKIDLSLYPQLEVELGDQVYKVRPINRATFEGMAAAIEKTKGGGPEAVGIVYDQAAILIDAPKELIDSLDYRILTDILKGIRTQVESPGEEQKNASEAGPEPSQQ